MSTNAQTSQYHLLSTAVSIIGMPILFHNGECAIYRHLGLLEPFTAALLAIKL